MLVVTMTSWTKRIGNVRKVVESVMSGTVKPDRLYLNLSEEEFKGVKLPDDLVKYFESDERLVINWVPGENTKSMKKVFPILEYLDDEDIIITADDDILFPKGLIESRVCDFERNGRKFSITSNSHRMGLFPGMYVCSAVSLFTKRMLKNWDRFVNSDIIRTYNDDRTSLYIMWFNGFLNRPCTKYDVKELVGKYSLNSNDTGLSKSGVVTFAGKYDSVADRRLKEMGCPKSVSMSGWFNRDGVKKTQLKSDVEKKQEKLKTDRDKRYERIAKLRKDISEGNVVKVSLGNGRFAWKRVK